MLEKLHGIYIKGGCFDEETRLTNILSKRVNIVYGRNGSGKSSIARGFASLTGQNNGFEVSFDNNADGMTEHLYVFNEDFIRDNVGTKPNGLETIVSIGKQVGLDKDIDDLTAKIKAAQDYIDALEKNLPDTDNLEKSLNTALKNGNLYTNLERLGRKQITRLLETVKADGEKATGSLKELKEKLDKGLQFYETLGNGASVNWTKPILPAENLAKAINGMLVTALDKPKDLSDDDKRMLEVAVNPHLAHYIDEAYERFADENMDYCPLCHQPISDEYKRHLFDVVAQIRDGATDEFKQKLQRAIDGLAHIDLGGMPEDAFFDADREDCKAKAQALDGVIDVMKKALEEKKDYMYEAHGKVDEETYFKTLDDCKKAIDALSDRVNEINNSVSKKAKLQKELLELNNQVAYLEKKTDFDNLEKVKAGRKKSLDKIEELNGQIRDWQTKKSDYIAQAANTNVALDYINSCLALIFADKNRLRLENNGNSQYVLKVRNQDVTPDRVSTGERNVIALSYFFANMLENKSIDDIFKDEMMVVIDDPISSFDTNNRMGIMSFVKVNMEKVLSGNRWSKMLFLTHDIETVNDLSAIYINLKRGPLGISSNNDPDNDLPIYYELHNRRLHKKNRIMPNTYSRLMEKILDFAEKDLDDDEQDYGDEGIGNIMRRFVEMYKSFKYAGDDINKAFDDLDVKREMPEKLRGYFSNLNVMMVLNGKSHGENMDLDNMYDEVFGLDQLQKLARNLLTFIYVTDTPHLKYTIDRMEGRCWNDEKDFIESCYEYCLETGNASSKITKRPKDEYEGQVLTVERDKRNLWHCKDCGLKPDYNLIPNLSVGDQVKILSVGPDNRQNFKYYAYKYERVAFANEHKWDGDYDESER